MQDKLVHIMLAISCLSIAGSAFSADLFDFSRLPEAKYRQNRESFERALQGWKSETLDNAELRWSSDLNVYFTGQSFVDLVHLGPAAAPYLAEALQEDGYKSFFLDCGLDYLMGGFWTRVAGIEINHLSGTEISSEIKVQVTKWWKDVAGQCALVWDTRRAAFDTRLKHGKPTAEDLLDLRKEAEWMNLRTMGLYAVPSVMKRVQDGKSDIYDLYLLNIWTAPFQIESQTLPKYATGGVEKSVPAPTRKRLLPKEYNLDTSHWLRWWDENKEDYWWLMPE